MHTSQCQRVFRVSQYPFVVSSRLCWRIFIFRMFFACRNECLCLFHHRNTDWLDCMNEVLSAFNRTVWHWMIESHHRSFGVCLHEKTINVIRNKLGSCLLLIEWKTWKYLDIVLNELFDFVDHQNISMLIDAYAEMNGMKHVILICIKWTNLIRH